MIKFEDDLDALFKSPLKEFTAARNALAARLRKSGQVAEAEKVKTLSKPSISAWAVNQLYWNHQDAFKKLIAAGERFGRAQASQLAGKGADTRAPLAERREALSALGRHATRLLNDAGHNPSPDVMRRITATLEALSVYSSFDNAPAPGRLTDDIDPPGFESVASFIPSDGKAARPSESTRVISFKPKSEPPSGKIALAAAERVLRETQTKAQAVAAELKRATEHANQTEKERRKAEEIFTKARVASEEARKRLHTISVEAEKTARALERAERGVVNARKDLKNGSD